MIVILIERLNFLILFLFLGGGRDCRPCLYDDKFNYFALLGSGADIRVTAAETAGYTLAFACFVVVDDVPAAVSLATLTPVADLTWGTAGAVQDTATITVIEPALSVVLATTSDPCVDSGLAMDVTVSHSGVSNAPAYDLVWSVSNDASVTIDFGSAIGAGYDSMEILPDGGLQFTLATLASGASTTLTFVLEGDTATLDWGWQSMALAANLTYATRAAVSVPAGAGRTKTASHAVPYSVYTNAPPALNPGASTALATSEGVAVSVCLTWWCG